MVRIWSEKPPVELAFYLSDTDEVARICDETDIDFLAVGIGTAHGFYDTEPDVRLDLLSRLSKVASRRTVVNARRFAPRTEAAILRLSW